MSLIEDHPAPISSLVKLNFTVYVQFMENVTSSDISNLLNGKFRNAFADNFFIETDRVSNVTVDFIGIRNYTSSR